MLAVCESLQEIFENGAYTEQVVEKLLKRNSRWGSRDRKFLAGTLFSLVRGKRWYESIVESMGHNRKHQYFLMVGVYLMEQGYSLPDWPEFSALNQEEVFRRMKELSSDLKIRYSLSDWLNEKGEKEFGREQWAKELVALNTEAAVVLRVNALKTTKKELLDLFKKEEIETTPLQREFCEKHPHAEFAIELKQRVNFNNNATYQSGFFEIQDAGSQLIAPMLDVEPGNTVVDACAGAGGKTLHLAALMQNRGELIAMDIEPRKLKILEQRAGRAGVKIARTEKVSPEAIAKLRHRADRLLLDVPCTGSGVLKRQVDTKWKLNEEELQRLVLLQREILSNYVKMLKPGGKLVYATCSIFSEENEEQVQWFLNAQKDQFRLIKQKRVLPSEGYDGFYMALMERV